MRVLLGRAACAGALLALSACASTEMSVSPYQARDAITSTAVIVPISQSEIYVDVPASQVSRAAGGGLLPALIDATVDSVKASNAAKDLKPLRDAVVDYDFDHVMVDEFRKSLSADAWLHLRDVKVVKDTNPSMIDRAREGEGDDAVLVATTNYHLSNDAGSLWIEVHAAVYLKPNVIAKLAPTHDPGRPAWSKVLWVSYSLPDAARTRADNLRVWADDGGARLRRDLTSGAAKAAELIAEDMASQDQPAGVTNSPGGSVERRADGSETFHGVG